MDQNLLASIAQTHKHGKVRELALKKVKDQDVLAEIAKFDSGKLIRELAFSKLTKEMKSLVLPYIDSKAASRVKDPEMLLDIEKKGLDADIRSAVLKNKFYSDQSTLAEVAENERSDQIRKAAVEKLRDQTLLKKITKKDKDLGVRIAAVEHLTDQTYLADIALHHKNSYMREASVKHITDQNLLKTIARKDKESHVRVAALENENYKDEESLVEIATSDKSTTVRMAAADKIADTTLAQRVYLDIARNEEDSYIREGAVKKLFDKNALYEIAIQDDDPYVRETALKKLPKTFKINASGYTDPEMTEKLRNPEVLMEIARNTTDLEVCLAALRNPCFPDQSSGIDQEGLVDKARNSSDSFARKPAVEKMTNQAALADIAISNLDDCGFTSHITNVGEAAVARIYCNALLVEIAQKALHFRTREAALRSPELKDIRFLTSIAKNDRNRDTRIAAVENPNFSDPVQLADIGKTDSDYLVRAMAVKKIPDQAMLQKIYQKETDDFVRLCSVENPSFTDCTVLAKIAKKDKNEQVRTAALKKIGLLTT